MHRVAFLCSLVIAVQVHAQPSPPRFIVHTVDGPLAPAPLVHIADDFTLKAGTEVAGKDLASIRQVAKALPRFLTQNVLLLNNGDRVPVDVKAGCGSIRIGSIFDPVRRCKPRRNWICRSTMLRPCAWGSPMPTLWKIGNCC